MQAVNEMKRTFEFKVGGGPGDVLAGSYPSSSIHNINPKMTNELVAHATLLQYATREKKSVPSCLLRKLWQVLV